MDSNIFVSKYELYLPNKSCKQSSTKRWDEISGLTQKNVVLLCWLRLWPSEWRGTYAKEGQCDSPINKNKRVCQNRHALFAFIVSQAAQQDETFFPITPVFPFPSSHKEGKGRIGRKMQPCRAEK